MPIEIGTPLPSLSGTIDDGSTLELDKLRGKPLVIYFYPKDNTPGCIKQGEGFRDLYSEYQALDCTIIGVSRDSVASHQRFRERREFPFVLVADTDEVWCNAFGVLAEKSMFGRRYIGIVRSTFLFGADGTLVQRWSPARVAGHAEAVLAELRKLEG